MTSYVLIGYSSPNSLRRILLTDNRSTYTKRRFITDSDTQIQGQ